MEIYHSQFYKFSEDLEWKTEKHLPAKVWAVSNVNMRAQKASAEIMLF